MARCDFCGTAILFGGRKQGDLQFCSVRCQQNSATVALARQLPTGDVQRELQAVHAGLCPKCGGNGPVDVHVRHKVWSAIALTSWSSTPKICCRPCGVRSQLGAALFSAVLGWWGFPWGVLITPLQIGRNVYGMIKGPDPSRPSPMLERSIRLAMVARNAYATRNATVPAKPVNRAA